jgi:signal transduction histidine kinase
MTDPFVVLVVDDNPPNRFTLKALLSRLPDTEVIEASSGEEALTRTILSAVHLILLDVQMPGMDGFETARLLRMTERTRNIPVIFLTAVFKAEEFAKRGFAVGAVDYLTKPLEDNLLLSRIRFYQVLHSRESRLAETVQQLRKQELSLIAALSQAEAANRAKNTFLANMSHELRTPLNAIIGFSELMTRSDALDREDKKNLEIINRSGNHLLTLINEILDFSKIEAGRVELIEETTDVERLLGEVVALLRPRAEQAGLTLALRAEGLPAALRVDATKLRQILLNLLGNAIKFTRRGSVTLDAKGQLAEGHAARIDFQVRDTGIGIAPADQQRIFEPFTQIVTHATASGTGLGLAITWRYLAMMGGGLAVESTPDRGSTFRFALVLPLVDEPLAAPTAKGPVIGLAEADRGKRILIVEDDADARRLLAQLLAPLGFVIAEAADGVEAVAGVAGCCPDLIIMDWRMPNLDGLEATRRIRAMREEKGPPILMCTANAFEEQRREAMAAGASAFLAKPVRQEDLYAALETHLGLCFRRGNSEESGAAVPADLGCDSAEFAMLGDDVKRALREAVVELSPDKVGAVVARIASDQPRLARSIAGMTENFQFQELWNLLQAER